MPYYEYYSFSYFFLIILVFFFIIIILFPNYIKKDIVPPLSNATYTISNPIGTFDISNTNNSTFNDLVIQDDDDSLEFEGTAFVSYIPYYEESHKRIIGFFELNISTSAKRDIAFRVVDINQSPSSNLSRYNYGWTSLSTEATQGSTPVYKVILPFNVPGFEEDNHDIRVQIAAAPGDSNNLELSSAYLYYYCV